MPLHEISGETEPVYTRRIAGPPKPDDKQLPLFAPPEAESEERGGESGEAVDCLNEHGFPGPDWPGWDLGATRLAQDDPEEFARLAQYARGKFGVELS